jgi:hypothetical protein
LCCYWFEKARAVVEKEPNARVGLLATQAIRNDAARTVIERIKSTGDVFFALSDREWVLDGASVHISMVGFTGTPQPEKQLDGRVVPHINADLSAGADVTSAQHLSSMEAIAFVGDVKGGPFEIPQAKALEVGQQPSPNGLPPFDVVRPYVNGLDVTRRHRDIWVIDFGSDMTLEHAAGYGAPFEFVAARKTSSQGWAAHSKGVVVAHATLSLHAPGHRRAGSLHRDSDTHEVPSVRLDEWFQPPGPPACRVCSL